MRFVSAVLATLVVAAPLSLRAEGGRIEINAACASVGCFAGDAPGYPVTITAPGSYVLTSDLVLPAGVSGIILAANDVHIDMNDFAIRGPASCNPGACTSGGTSVQGISRQGVVNGNRSSVRNGEITGVDGLGILLQTGSQVRNLAVSSVTGYGIEFGGINSIVEGCSVDRTGQSGIAVQPGPAVVRDNALSNTGLRVAGPAISGARSGGTGNECDDGSCTPLRRYYLSRLFSTGDTALTTCAAGFHMASLWEIRETATLSYDGRLGVTFDGGPPEDDPGWIKSGFTGAYSFEGLSDCSGWTSKDSTVTGFQAALHILLLDEAGMNQVYGLNLRGWTWQSVTACSAPHPVWCVED